ncbi:MAG: hypothetical protein H7Y31_13310 [Chitinophagaceae bacterium]|nr:hypothetical protein [Chitinophagaceae bacterium]
MSNTTQFTLNSNRVLPNFISCVFGIVFFAIGVINTFWGNDTLFGLFIIALSFAFFPPLTTLLKKLTRLSIPGFVKVVLAIFIIWAALGVGELPDKIDLMLASF